MASSNHKAKKVRGRHFRKEVRNPSRDKKRAEMLESQLEALKETVVRWPRKQKSRISLRDNEVVECLEVNLMY